MSNTSPPREAFKVRIGDYLTEHELEGLGISADWFLYLSPTIAPALAKCFTQLNTYDLLTCPCCGGGATIIGTYPTNEFSAICRDCGLETAHKMTPREAAEGWNKRYAPDEGSLGDEISEAARDRIGIPFPKEGGAPTTPPPSAVPEWRPIESAPMDYTRVLLTDCRTVEVGFYDAERREWMTDSGWVYGLSERPANWMPLPAAPEPGEADDAPR